MKLIFPRCLLTAFSAFAVLAFTVPARAQTGEEENPPSFEDHEVDAKVKEILKQSKSPEDAVRSMTQLVMKNPKDADLWYQVAETCYAAHDLQKAISAYKKCAELDPKRKGIWDTIGQLYFSSGDVDKAVDAFKSALLADPQDLDALNSTALMLMSGGKLDAAQEVLDRIKTINPDYAKAWNTSGVLLARRKKWKEAADAYGKALALKPDYAEAAYNRGVASFNLGYHPAAIADFEKATQLTPTLTRAWIMLMKTYYDNKQNDEATKAARAALAANPDDGRLWQFVGLYYIAIKDGAGSLDALQKAAKLLPDLQGINDEIAAARQLANGNTGGNVNPAAEAEAAALKKAMEDNPKDGTAWLKLGEFYLKQLRPQDAVDCLKTACDLMPDNSLPRNLLAEACLETNRNDEAQAALEKAKSMGDNTPQLWNEFGRLYQKEQKMKEAVEAYGKALELKPDYAVARYNLGLAHVSMGDHAGAIADFQKLTQTNPDYVPAWIALMQAYSQNGQNDEAIKSGRDAVELYANNAMVWQALGGIYYLAKDQAHAIDALEKARKLNPDLRLIDDQLAAAHALGKDATKAETDLKKALETNPKDLQALTDLGRLYIKQAKYKEAIDCLKKASDLKPDDASILVLLGQASAGSAHYDDAIAFLDKAKAMGNKSADLWFVYGLVYGAEKKFKEAKDSLDKVLELKPDSSQALYRRGLDYMLLGNRAAAIADFQKAAQIDPVFEMDWLALMQAYRDDKQPGEVVKTGEAAVAKNPDNAVLWQSLGIAYTEVKDEVRAKEALAKAAKLNPDINGLPGNLAAASMLGGNNADSEAALKKAVDQNPKDGYSWGNLAHLYIREGKYPDAIVSLEKACQLLPDNVDLRLQLGEACLVVADKNDEAKASLEKAMALGDNSPQLWFAFGLVYEREKKFKESLDAYEVARKMDPANGTYWAHAADLQRVNGHMDEALQDAQEALRVAPDNAECYMILGAVYQTQKRIKEASEAYQKALALNPDTKDARVYEQVASMLMAGRTTFTKEELDHVVQLLEKAVQLDPKNPNVLRLLGGAYNTEKRYADAVRVDAEAEQISPGNSAQLLAYADALVLAGKFDEAEPILVRIAPEESGNYAYWDLYYKLYNGRGKTDDAIPFFQKQLKKQPGNAALMLILGDMQIQGKDYKAAAATLKKASELKKDDAFILRDYGQALMLAGDTAALVPARRAYELKPDDPATMFATSNVLLHFGKFQESEDICQKLIAINPNSPMVWQVLMACYKSEGKDEDVARCVKKLAEIGVSNPVLTPAALTPSGTAAASTAGQSPAPVKILPPE